MDAYGTLFSHLVDFVAVCVPIYLAWKDTKDRANRNKDEVLKQVATIEVKVDALWKHYTHERSN